METTIVCWSYIGYWGYIGRMENGNYYIVCWGEWKMETTIVYWGYMGIMEKKMETVKI